MLRTCLLICLPVIFSCSSKTEQAEVMVQDITESVYASGNIKSRNQYQVFASVTGLVQRVLVKEGDLVTRGQPIMQLADDASRLSAENARIVLEQSTTEANREKLNELKLAIELAGSRMQNDSILLERQKNLWAQQIGTRNELEQRELAYRNSRIAYESAKLRHNDFLKQIGFAQRQSAKNLQISRKMLQDFTIRSEAAGRVYSLLKEPGEIVNPQLPVAVIGDAADFIIELQVDEYDIALVQPAQTVYITMDSYRGQLFEARVERIIPIMNERSRSFSVEAVFIESPPGLYPGLTAEANIIIRNNHAAITIPRNYLIRDSLVLMKDGSERRVTTGIRDYQRVEITGGLKEGEIIIKPEP